VRGKSVAVANVDGKLFAINSVCLHHGGPLGDGELDGTVVSCPWHGWQWDPKTGQAAHNSAAKVAIYQLKIENGEVMIEV